MNNSLLDNTTYFDKVGDKKEYPKRKIIGGFVGLAALGAALACTSTGAAQPQKDLVTNLKQNVRKDRMVEEGLWGSWKGIKSPGGGWVACGMKVRFEKSQGSSDDTALNGIKVMYCDEKDWWTQKEDTVYAGKWGDWDREYTMCNKDTYITAAKARFEKHGGDDTALNGIQIRCRQRNWILDSEPVVNKGLWGDWREWTSEQNYGQYFMTGANMRFEKPGGDDTAGNGLKIYTHKKFVGGDFNVLTPGWVPLKRRSGAIETTVTNTITDEYGTAQDTLQESHMDASVSVHYEVSSGIHTGGGEISMSAGSSNEVKDMWSKSFSHSFVEEDKYYCAAKEGKYTTLYVFDIDLESNGESTMKMRTNNAVCCYDAQVPKCIPSKCIGECCQTCLE